MPARPDRKSVSFTIREDLVDRLDKEADDRVVGRNLLVEKALEGYLDALPPIDLPDVVSAAEKAAEKAAARPAPSVE